MRLKFSIIIPVYNLSKYISQAIVSIINQSYSDYELIIIDDGSTDNSIELCNYWASIDKRISIYQQTNSGVAVARNKGIQVANGDYIIFLDGDDWWKSTSVLEKISKRLELHPVDVLSFNFQKCYNNTFSNAYYSEESFDWNRTDGSLNYLMKKEIWISSPCNKAIKLNLLKEKLIYFRKEISSEDVDWCCRLAVHATSFDYLNEVVFVYRQRMDSASHTMSLEKVQCFWENIKECINILDKEDLEKAKSIMPYVSYQYGVFLQLLADVENEKQALIYEANEYSYLLSMSNNHKIKMIDMIFNIGGIELTLRLLRLKTFISSMRKKKGKL